MPYLCLAAMAVGPSEDQCPEHLVLRARRLGRGDPHVGNAPIEHVGTMRRLIAPAGECVGERVVKALAYVYFEEEPGRTAAAKLFTLATRPGASPPTSPSCRSCCVNPDIFGQSEQGFGTPRSGRHGARENGDQRSSGPSKASPLTTASSPKRARTRSTACSTSTARSSTKSLGSA
jgi:hypothetical protein